MHALTKKRAMEICAHEDHLCSHQVLDISGKLN